MFLSALVERSTARAVARWRLDDPAGRRRADRSARARTRASRSRHRAMCRSVAGARRRTDPAAGAWRSVGDERGSLYPTAEPGSRARGRSDGRAAQPPARRRPTCRRRALALALFMFALTWFGESLKGTLPGSDVGSGSAFTGWEAFTHSRWVWLLTILVALVSVIARAAAWQMPEWLKPGSVVALLGAVSALLIGYRILHHPAASKGFGGFHAAFGIRVGIWLGSRGRAGDRRRRISAAARSRNTPRDRRRRLMLRRRRSPG